MKKTKPQRKRLSLAGQVVSGLNQEGENHDYSDFENATIESCTFANARLTYTRFDGAQIIRSSFEGAAIQGAVLNGARICDTNMSNLHEPRPIACESATFERVNLEESNFKGSFAQHAKFSYCDMKPICFEYANLRGASLESCNAESSRLEGADMTGAKVVRCNFNDCDFDNTNLADATFHDTTLKGARFVSAHMTRVHLEGAQMQGAQMGGARLDSANLRHANLTKAILADAQLVDADLTNANLTNADLQGANLARAKLGGANLRLATYDSATTWPEGFVPPRDAYCNDAKHAARAKAEDVWERAGRQTDSVFIDAPNPNDRWSIIYALYPEFYTVIDRWAFPEKLAVAVWDTIDLGMSSIRKGDGVMPFESNEDKTTCLAYYLYSTLTSAQISAMAEIHRGLSIRRGRALNYDSPVVQMYLRLNDAVARARAQNVKDADKAAKKAALEGLANRRAASTDSSNALEAEE
jgi:uncharacterized protein YjbI with pentapeptide repeats